MKDRSEKINHFLLQEQMPDIIKVAGTDKRSSNNSSSKTSSTGTSSSSSTGGASFPKHSVSKRIVSAVDHVTQLRLDSVRCPQLEEYLPHILDLTVVRTTPNPRHPRGWSFANPVHALHMVGSQPGGETSSKVQKQRLPPTYMYGEEQHRTAALQTEGIAEYWCSFDGNVPDHTYELRKQMEAALASKPVIKPAPKILPPTPALSTPKVPSSTSVPLTGTKPEALPSPDVASSTPTQPKQSAPTAPVDQAASGAPPASQDSTKDGPSDPTADTTKSENGTAPADNVADPSMEEKAVSMEIDPPTSDPAPQGIKSSGDIVSSDSTTKDASGEIEKDDKVISSIDATTTVPEKEGAVTDTTPIPPAEPLPENKTSTEKISTEAEPANDGSSNTQTSADEKKDSSTPVVDKEGEDEDENAKMEVENSENSASSDTPLPPPSEPAKDKEVTEGILPDASKSSSIAQGEQAAPNNDATDDAKTKEMEIDPQDDAASSSGAKESSPESNDKEDAKVSPTSENRESEEVPAASKESSTIEGETTTKVTSAPESGQNQIPEQDQSDEKKAEVEDNSTLANEEKAVPEPVDKVSETKSSVTDVDSSETKKDAESNEDMPLDKKESNKAGDDAEVKSSDDVAMASNPTDTDIDDGKTKATANDDPMKAEETKSAEVKTDEETKKDDSTTDEKDKKVNAESPSQESKVDENEPKPIDVGSASTTNISPLPSSTTKPATGIVVTPSTTTTAPITVRPQIFPPPFKSDPAMDILRREEDKIRRARRSLTSKRVRKKPEAPTTSKEVTKKKRKVSERSSAIPGWKIPPTRELDIYEEEEYKADFLSRNVWNEQ